MRTYITLVIVIVIGIISLWLQEDSQQTPDVSVESEKPLADSFMRDFIVTQMNPQGQTEHVLKARKMLHYKQDNLAELEQPVILFRQQDKLFSVQADRAIYYQDQNRVQLYDNVILKRDAGLPDDQALTALPDNLQNELSIFTDYLTINTETQRAETDQAARLKTADAELQSIGLLIDNKQGIVKLKSQVKGRYEQPR
jgi:lipopolysaccharide export system protein LptC